jgi:hypothetical protein
MSDLSGEDAFDKVLEAALDAHHNARHAVDLQHAAKAMASAAERHADRARGEVERLEREKKNGLPKLRELWDAAKAVSDFRTTNVNDDTVVLANDLMVRLRSALDAAADFCDQIPF